MYCKRTGFRNTTEIDTATLVLTNPSAYSTDEEYVLPFFGAESSAEASAFAAKSQGYVYTWKCEGAKNWLVAGEAGLIDCMGYVVLSENRGVYLDVGDDEME